MNPSLGGWRRRLGWGLARRARQPGGGHLIRYQPANRIFSPAEEIDPANEIVLGLQFSTRLSFSTLPHPHHRYTGGTVSSKGSSFTGQHADTSVKKNTAHHLRWIRQLRVHFRTRPPSARVLPHDGNDGCCDEPLLRVSHPPRSVEHGDGGAQGWREARLRETRVCARARFGGPRRGAGRPRARSGGSRTGERATRIAHVVSTCRLWRSGHEKVPWLKILPHAAEAPPGFRRAREPRAGGGAA